MMESINVVIDDEEVERQSSGEENQLDSVDPSITLLWSSVTGDERCIIWMGNVWDSRVVTTQGKALATSALSPQKD
jgi:hypothetical protein